MRVRLRGVVGADTVRVVVTRAPARHCAHLGFSILQEAADCVCINVEVSFGGLVCCGRKAFSFPIVLEVYGVDVLGVAACQTHRVNLLSMS